MVALIAIGTTATGEPLVVAEADADAVASVSAAQGERRLTGLEEIVVIAARRPQPSEDVVGSVSVIARSEIERLQAQDIRDLVRYKPGDSAWTLLPGLRWDRYQVDAEVDPLFAQDNPTGAVADTDTRRLTSKLGARLDLDRDNRLYLAWAEGFRAPPFADVNIALSLPVPNYVVLPNPDLKPESSRGLELGFNHDSHYAALRVALFDNRYRNLIESRANLGLDANGTLVFQSVNRARARIRGAEGALRLGLGAFGETLAPWSLRAAASIARGDDTSRNLPLTTVQPDRLVFGIERVEQGAWPELGLTVNAVARVERLNRSATNLFAPPGYVSVDLRARKRLGAHLTVDAAILNLGDIRHWDYAALRGVLRTNVPAPAFYTAPGRNVALTVGLSW